MYKAKTIKSQLVVELDLNAKIRLETHIKGFCAQISRNCLNYILAIRSLQVDNWDSYARFVEY